MRIAILSRNKKLYSTKRLAQAAKQRGHVAEVIDTLRCYMNITSTNPKIHYKGKALKSYDAIIPRIGASITFYGAAVVRQFEKMGVYCINNAVSIKRSRDKLHFLQLLSKNGIDLPKTGFAHSPDEISDLIKMVGGPPLVIKFLEGTQGIGVILVETVSAARSVIEAFLDLKVNILVQEFIKDTGGEDIRCLVVGGEVVAAMKRKAATPEEFRANIHRGGSATIADLTEEEKELAKAITKISGLNFAGVDLIRSSRGPLVMEVNSSPGIEGIERATGIDVANKVIEFIEKNASESSDENGVIF